jgi:hypothetical protein
MNVKGALNRMVDPDGGLARAFDDPFTQHSVSPVTPGAPAPIVRRETLPPSRPAGDAPSFIPPAAAPPAAPPAFVPPAAAAREKMAEDF